MRAYVLRDLLDTVTLHPPAGFSLRVLNPASAPGAPEAGAQKAASDAAGSAAAEGTLGGPPATEPAAGSGNGSGAAAQKAEQGLPRPPGKGPDDLSSAEAAAPVVGLEGSAPDLTSTDSARVVPEPVRQGTAPFDYGL